MQPRPTTEPVFTGVRHDGPAAIVAPCGRTPSDRRSLPAARPHPRRGRRVRTSCIVPDRHASITLRGDVSRSEHRPSTSYRSVPESSGRGSLSRKTIGGGLTAFSDIRDHATVSTESQNNQRLIVIPVNRSWVARLAPDLGDAEDLHQGETRMQVEQHPLVLNIPYVHLERSGIRPCSVRAPVPTR